MLRSAWIANIQPDLLVATSSWTLRRRCARVINMTAPAEALVSAKWLADMVSRNRVGPSLRILDTSWYLPQMKRDGKLEFAQRHIPGASFFDIDACVDASSEFDHTLPSAEFFSGYVGDLGIGDDTHVVVYDASDFGAFTCTRVWWMFRYFGHSRVSLLDGGFGGWLRGGYAVASAYTRPEAARFAATVSEPSWAKSFEDMTRNLTSREFQVVDVRTPGRFSGKEPELREGRSLLKCRWYQDSRVLFSFA